MTTQTLKTVPLGETIDHFVHELGRAAAAIAAGQRAARDYRRLSTHTDAALAREGLTRQDVARAVQQRHFA